MSINYLNTIFKKEKYFFLILRNLIRKYLLEKFERTKIINRVYWSRLKYLKKRLIQDNSTEIFYANYFSLRGENIYKLIDKLKVYCI